MSSSAAPVVAGRRLENLALCFQELLTVGERLRSQRQPVSDANVFRSQLRQALAMADQEARRQGYTAEDIQYAVFAVVAFLDESILNLRSPVFADWPRQPLQEELFGHHIAGEVFFQHLQRLLGRDETHELADVLEVYHLCLLLGFAGRYSLGGRGELRSIIDTVAAKILRIRQPSPELSPAWRLPNDAPPPMVDPWVKRLMFGAIGVLAFVVVMFLVYKFTLMSGVSTLGNMALGRS
jgi:type VI secretion system protein ImpK